MPRDNKTSDSSHFFSRLQRGVGTIRIWLTKNGTAIDSGMLWPTLLTITAFVLIQNIGQLRSLGSALAAALRARDEYYDGGYSADSIDLFIWWASCWLVLLTSTTFSARQKIVDIGSRAGKFRLLLDNISLHLISCLLVLSPLFAAGFNIWQPELMLSIVTMALLMVWVFNLGRLYSMFFIACMFASISANHHGQFEIGAFVLGIWALSLILHPNWKRYRWFWFVSAMVSMICSSVATLGLIFTDSLLAWQNPHNISWDYRVLFLAAWWLAPALLLQSAKYVRWQFTDRQINVSIIVTVFAIFAIVARWPASIYGLNTLCMVLAGLLAMGKIIKTHGSGLIGRCLLYSYLIAAAWKISLLEPTPDFSNEELPAEHSSYRPSSFFQYYEQWLNARGETPREHGPLILVAVSGGGIRAAAHASVALALADDTTGGKFGERTLMISAVSGGALGAATWLAKRVDGLPPADPALIRSGGLSPSGLALSRFYRSDFLSPVVNRMLFHDFPLAASIISNRVSDRDNLLQQEWETSWENLLRENGIQRKDGSFFQQRMRDLSAGGLLPLIVFNTTSAADGRNAVYSSYPGAVRWAWQLDTDTKVGRAILDSARFAGISPVGEACAEERTSNIPRIRESTVKCKQGFRPLAVADGGYRDNSGLAEISVVVDELARYGDPLDQVFIIQIRSDPYEGIKLLEGARFNRGSLLSELLSPAIVQESGRSGHPEAYEQQILGHHRQLNMYTWGLQHDIKASIFSSHHYKERWPFDWLNQLSAQAEWERQAQLAPLGWTIDPQSFWALYSDSLMIRELPTFVSCKQMLPQYSLICNSLDRANRVHVQAKQLTTVSK